MSEELRSAAKEAARRLMDADEMPDWSDTEDVIIRAFTLGVEYARRTPPPDTANVFQTWRNELAKCGPDDYVPDQIRRVLSEWPQPEDPAHAPS